MAFQFKLPDIGEGIHEGEIVKWFVKPGDKVKEDDLLLEVQNDKTVVEIPSPVDGKILELKVEEGTVAVVGDVLVTIEAEGYETETEEDRRDRKSRKDRNKTSPANRSNRNEAIKVCDCDAICS